LKTTEELADEVLGIREKVIDLYDKEKVSLFAGGAALLFLFLETAIAAFGEERTREMVNNAFDTILKSEESNERA